MLEYCKKILSVMTFDVELFKKELQKCFSYLNFQERLDLGIWNDNNYLKLPA
ncbi:MAG: hypothetical protein MJ198_03790 [Bacteroidales bacterium]|nr:hypothetical protein [Bacteroidales bacterium]